MGATPGRPSRVLSQRESSSLERQTTWLEYRLWNLQLCEHFFSGAFANQPVYIDVDDATRKALAQEVCGGGDGAKHLIDAVRATLDRDANPFSSHLDNERQWRGRKQDGDPPFIALLAFFSLVAEQMVASADFAPTNYYGRLCEMLGIAGNRKADVERGYRQAAERLWPSLNAWLSEAAGMRGYPTARALDHRKYVSIAISQALVRQQDRILLRRIFAEVGFEPRQRIQVPEMKSILATWASSHPGTSLARLLSRGPEVQQRVAEIARSELEAWDGSVGDSARTLGFVRLFAAAELRYQPLPAIELYLGVGGTSEIAGSYKLRGDSGPDAKAALERASGRVRFELTGNLMFRSMEPWSEISAGDALLARIDLVPENDRGPIISRNGQAILALSYRADEGLYREVQQPSLMDRLLVLTHDSVAPAVERHLKTCARPGFRSFAPSQLRNLPRHWTAFVDVQIAQRVDVKGMEALTPLSERQLVLSRGLPLGRDTWHSAAAPEVLIAAPAGEKFRAVLAQTLAFEEKIEEKDLGLFEGAAAILLDSLAIPDGDYDVAVRAPGKSSRAESIDETPFRLRSSDSATPWRFVLGGRNLARVTSGGAAWLLTGQLLEASAEGHGQLHSHAIRGCQIGGEVPEVNILSPDVVPSSPGIGTSVDDALVRQSDLSTLTQAAGSCITRGYHVFQYPFLGPGAQRGILVKGQCSDCRVETWNRTGGTRRHQPMRAQHRRSQQGTSLLASAESAVGALQTPSDHGIPASTVFDALNCIRGGSALQLRTLTSTLDDSPWAMIRLANELSALGHLELLFDSTNHRLVSWQIAPSTFAEVKEGDFVLAGWRSRRLSMRIVEEASAAGMDVVTECQRVPILRLRGSREALISICDRLRKDQWEIRVELDFAMRLVKRLPALSSLMAVLPIGRPASAELEMFDYQSARWRTIGDIPAPGAYRSRIHGNAYFYISEDGLSRGEASIADARTVKHLAARELRRSLIGYSSEAKTLVVPYGCELPGLFERVAVMCSGRAPETHQGLVTYQDVPESIAAALWARLTA